MSFELQSVVFEKNKWNQKKAQEWLKKNNFKTSFYGKPVDIKETQLRYRQTAPSRYKNYITEKLDNGVLLILGRIK